MPRAFTSGVRDRAGSFTGLVFTPRKIPRSAGTANGCARNDAREKKQRAPNGCIMPVVGLGQSMERLRSAPFLLLAFLFCAATLPAQDTSSKATPAASQPNTTLPTPGPQALPSGPPIPANAPHISKQTRYEIIRDFETQLVYTRTAFPMGTKGLALKDGVITPNGQELNQLLALWGPALKPGDPALISFVQFKDNHIHFDINGGAMRRKKWYQHIQVSGNSGTPIQLSPNESQQNPHGTYLEIYFDRNYVPEMTAQQLRDLLFPALDFNARNKEEAYLDTVPPKVKQAIQEHRVLVGMNSEMVVHAKGRPPKKVREKDGDTEYEEWIYGEPPQDVDFVRIVGDEVVRVETMKVGGQKIVRTEKEVILERPDKEAEAKKEEERSPNAPTLRRPGENPDNVPAAEPSNAPSSLPPAPPTNPPGSPGPGEVAGGSNR